MTNECTDYSFYTCDSWNIWSNRAYGATTLDGSRHTAPSGNIWDDQVQVDGTTDERGRAGAWWTNGNGYQVAGARTSWVTL